MFVKDRPELMTERLVSIEERVEGFPRESGGGHTEMKAVYRCFRH